MNFTRFFLLLFFCTGYFSSKANYTGLTYEYTGYDEISGFVSVKVYATFDQAGDQLNSIYGNNIHQLNISCTGDFYQHVAGGALTTSINPIFFAFFPELAYDSWFTIGLESQTGNVMTSSGLNFGPFEAGGDLIENDVAGGQIICAIGSAQCFPLAGKVLIGQFTVNGDIDILLNIVWRDISNVAHDVSGISLHIEGGDPGCTDQYALNFDPAASFNDNSCTYPDPAYTGLSFETVAFNVLPGFHTHRIYADFSYEGDQLSALFGQDISPLSISTTGTFYQDATGGPFSNDVNPALYPAFPLLEFDSWLTIGTDAGAGEVQSIGMNTSTFESGGALTIDDSYGGAWFVLPGTEPAAYPDQNGKVLIAQLTSDGDVNLSLNLQYRAANGSDPQVFGQIIEIPFLVAGCTDVMACNFNPAAEANDGSCISPDLYFADADGDGYGNPLSETLLCAIQPGFVLNNQDCDDTRNDVHPGAPGTNEGIDNNCNNVIDPGEEILDSCIGDFSDDGEINTTDLLLFLGNLGCTSACGFYDLTGDGVVNTGDILIFLGYFGTFCP